MKLLSPKELKDKRGQSAQQAREIDQSLAKKTKELNAFRDEHERKKKRILDEYIAFAEKVAGDLALLETGNATNKERKAQASRSLSALIVEANKKFESAKEIEELTEKHSANLLQREQKLIDDRKKLDERGAMVSAEAEKVGNAKDALNKAHDDFEREKRADNIRLEKRTEAMEKREKGLDSRENDLERAIISLERSVTILEGEKRQLDEQKKRNDKENAEEKRAIADSRATLDRAWAELRRQQK